MHIETKNLQAMVVVVVSAMFLLTVPFSATAAQYDAGYYELEKQFGDQWLADDKAVQSKYESQ